MNSTFKSVLFTLLGIVIFFAVASFFISLIPYLLVGGLVIYIIIKLKQAFGKKQQKSSEGYATYNSYVKNEEVYATQEDTENEKVIDVDYKEVQ